MSDNYLSVSSHEGSSLVELNLKGQWVLESIAKFSDAFEAVYQDTNKEISEIIFNGKDLEDIDPSGAWIIVKFIKHLKERQGESDIFRFNNFHDNHMKIIEIVGKVENPDSDVANKKRNFISSGMISIGKVGDEFFRSFADMLTFIGMLCSAILKTIFNPTRLRLKSTIYHINETGIKAVPIIMLMSFLISMVLGYQGANQLQKFGATIFTIDMVAISMLREMGVLITAIMVAGRSGSAFAAQIGVMRVNEEVDALKTIGLDPFELLILPRIIGLLIALPALTLIADIVGLFGTWFVAYFLLDISTLQFLGRLQAAVSADAFMVGLIKAPIFALLIGMVGCLQGLEVEKSAAEVGTRTTMAVVHSIFLVILADAIFSVIFTIVGI